MFAGRIGLQTLTGSVEYLHLNADSAVAANQGDNDVFIGRLGISFSYCPDTIQWAF